MRQIQLDAPKSLAQRVIVQLRQAIIEGKFPLGSLIPEEMLAQSFGVSRTPVREAISQLQLEGLVVVRPQVGSFVFSPTPEDVAALCEFRHALEPQAARLSLKVGREQAVAEVNEAVQKMEIALSERDFAAYGQADTRFHEAFFHYCGNPYIQQAYQLITGRVAALRFNLSYPISIEDPFSFEEHKTLARLFTNGEMEQFDKVLSHHLWKSGKTYTRILEKGINEYEAVAC